MHEFSHGLGPGTIKLKDGSESTVNRELKDLYSGIEEAKADILGLFCTRVLVKEGFLDKSMETKDTSVSSRDSSVRYVSDGLGARKGESDGVQLLP